MAAKEGVRPLVPKLVDHVGKSAPETGQDILAIEGILMVNEGAHVELSGPPIDLVRSTEKLAGCLRAL